MQDQIGQEDRIRQPGAARVALALGGLARGLWPRRPDRTFLAGLSDAGPPPGDTTVTIRALPQVPRRVPTAFVAEGVRSPAWIANVMTGFVVRHPAATFLLDPALCEQVETRAIAEIPAVLRGLVQPPAGALTIREALDRAGVGVAEIDFALPTHLHWDHVAGLLDLPGLPVRVHERERSWALEGEVAPAGGVRPALRGRPVGSFDLDGPPVFTFARSHDLFGDGAVVIVDLAGHTPGSVGVLLRTAGGPVLLAGDAAWHCLQVDRLRPKPTFPGRLVDADRDETWRTLHRLHAVRERVRVVPSHDHVAASVLS